MGRVLDTVGSATVLFAALSVAPAFADDPIDRGAGGPEPKATDPHAIARVRQGSKKPGIPLLRLRSAPSVDRDTSLITLYVTNEVTFDVIGRTPDGEWYLVKDGGVVAYAPVDEVDLAPGSGSTVTIRPLSGPLEGAVEIDAGTGERLRIPSARVAPNGVAVPAARAPGDAAITHLRVGTLRKGLTMASAFERPEGRKTLFPLRGGVTFDVVGASPDGRWLLLADGRFVRKVDVAFEAGDGPLVTLRETGDGSVEVQVPGRSRLWVPRETLAPNGVTPKEAKVEDPGEITNVRTGVKAKGVASLHVTRRPGPWREGDVLRVVEGGSLDVIGKTADGQYYMVRTDGVKVMNSGVGFVPAKDVALEPGAGPRVTIQDPGPDSSALDVRVEGYARRLSVPKLSGGDALSVPSRDAYEKADLKAELDLARADRERPRSAGLAAKLRDAVEETTHDRAVER